MTELEKQKLRIQLAEKIGGWLDIVLENDNNIGYVPENIETLMADAAFAVMMAITETNEYLKKEGLIKNE